MVITGPARSTFRYRLPQAGGLQRGMCHLLTLSPVFSRGAGYQLAEEKTFSILLVWKFGRLARNLA